MIITFQLKNQQKNLKENLNAQEKIQKKYTTFSASVKKENDEKITYRLKFIDSYRFVSTSLSNLVDNLSGVYDKECKNCMERKKKVKLRICWI